MAKRFDIPEKAKVEEKKLKELKSVVIKSKIEAEVATPAPRTSLHYNVVQVKNKKNIDEEEEEEEPEYAPSSNSRSYFSSSLFSFD